MCAFLVFLHGVVAARREKKKVVEMVTILFSDSCLVEHMCGGKIGLYIDKSGREEVVIMQTQHCYINRREIEK